MAKSLGLNIDKLKESNGISILSGNKSIKEGAFIAQAYAGHQFGHFTMLGDGRALLIGEHLTPKGERVDIQLKGSGKTPYSRGGDGRAVLGPMLREYIISEAMYNLGIPTTRSLSVIKTGEFVIRENIKEGAILARVASSHIRFGTFQFISTFGTKEQLKSLADYTINRHYSYIKDNENKYINFLKEVIKKHAKLVSLWQSIGFIHGVMNTDNMTISGETIDYGPCAFMDSYNPNTVFSSIDTQGRYSYKNQPTMTAWNLCRFAEALLPLLSDDSNESIKLAQNEISKFNNIYHENWLSKMRSKLGLFNEEKCDENIINDLLNIMKNYKSDYTNTFISLTFEKDLNTEMFKSKEFINWYKTWKNRLNSQSQTKDEVLNLMKNSNPAVIPRNHRVEEALSAADNGDYSIMLNLLKAISNPYEHSDYQIEYAKLPKASNKCYKTFCGT